MITVQPGTKPGLEKVTIVIDNADAETLVRFQEAIIELLKNYDFNNYGQIAGETVSNALTLLQAISPDNDQQIKAFSDEVNYLPLPGNITQEQTKAIREIIHSIKYPGSKDVSGILKQLLTII